MPSEAELTIRPARLSFRVLQADPQQTTAEAAARAVRRYVKRERPGLAGALEIRASGRNVLVRARGESPEAMLQELVDLLGMERDGAALATIEVDPAEFRIEVTKDAVPGEQVRPEREILRSRARCFPHTICEWFDISTGILLLTERRIVYEPQYVAPGGSGGGPRRTVIDLNGIRRAYRGEWWDIPCVMIETRERTHRFGWPARRHELDAIFDVTEWLEAIRRLLHGEEQG